LPDERHGVTNATASKTFGQQNVERRRISDGLAKQKGKSSTMLLVGLSAAFVTVGGYSTWFFISKRLRNKRRGKHWNARR